MADLKGVPSIGEVVAANYQILGTAGAGGMGVVYRALDLKLQRNVALKFLPPDLNASERDKQRFLKEARTASSLDHPNIGVIYGIEETSDERSFIAMAYYEGKSLAQRIRSGPVAPSEAAEIAIQMLKGLEHAHSQGIEHRDIKPSNIMLTQQGAVKIVDFGLAHVSQQTASKTHGISGTVAYMSPEQTLGKPINRQTDIWAAGIVMVEMLTGQNPFSRDTIPATVFAILNEPPKLPDDVPPSLQQVVYRALSKDPIRRYPSCSEMLRDLEIVRGGLPNSSSQKDWPTESKPFWKSKESGELRRSREYASVSAWAPPAPRSNWKPFVFGFAAVLVLVVCALLIPPVRERVTALLPVGDAENHRPKQAAYEGYLAALGYMDRFDKPGNLDRAVTALEGSLKIDPLFALGYAQLGEAYRMKYQTDRNPKWLELALSNCQRAEQLDNRIPIIYATLAEVHKNQGKQDLARQEFQQALDINPRDVAAIGGMARADQAVGRLQDAEVGLKKAVALRPDDWALPNDLGEFYRQTGKYPEAIAAYSQAVTLSPDNAYALNNLASAYLGQGDMQSIHLAEDALTRSLTIQPSYLAYTNLGLVYQDQKRYADSAAVIRKALELNDKDYLVWDNLRTDYEFLQDHAKADEALTKELPLAERHIQLEAQDGLANAIVATLYAKKGEFTKAESHIQSALAYSPDAPEVLQSVADAYENIGKREQAKLYLRKAVAKGATLETMASDPDLLDLLKEKTASLNKK